MLFKGLADLTWPKDAPAGSLQATFSRFNVVDRDGDLTLPSAFTDGQAVPMVWSHDWKSPVGRGVIRVLPDRAVFDGRFLETTAGREAYATVKQMSDLQEYSYGFQITDAGPGTHDGQPVRVLKSLEVFEVSPVLVGAGIGTGTDRIKTIEQDDALGMLADAVLELKVGRRFSAASRREIQTAIDALAALIADLAAEDESDPKGVHLEPVALAGITSEWLDQLRVRYRLGGD